MARERASVILGAGFSHAAGLPLARDLFEVGVASPSRGASKRFRAVGEAWRAWKGRHPGGGAEQFLAEVFDGAELPWAYAAEYVAAVLAGGSRYAGSVKAPLAAPAHRAFWQAVQSRFELGSVVTTNYDLLIERSLRPDGFHYGGLPRPQALGAVELTGEVPLFKLHGSLGWHLAGDELRLYPDMRPVFRNGGEAAIVPPFPKAHIPGWLTGVWGAAELGLRGSPSWIVCGFSLPAYDRALLDFFGRASQDVETIYLLDPQAAVVADRFKAIAPQATIQCLLGLPEGARNLASEGRLEPVA